MKKRLKVNGAIMFFAVLLIAVFPQIFFRNGHTAYFDEAAEAFGVVFILLGQIFRVSSRGYKSESSQGGKILIQGGPYSLIRNPMYLGILLIGLGIVLMLFNWWAMIIFLFIFITRYILLIFKEEKKLSQAFPKDYPAYQKQVPRILPSVATLMQKDIRGYLPLKMAWLKKEIGTILAVLLTTLFIESWEDIKSEGIKIYLKEATVMLVIIILFICLVVYLSGRTNTNND